MFCSICHHRSQNEQMQLAEDGRFITLEDTKTNKSPVQKRTKYRGLAKIGLFSSGCENRKPLKEKDLQFLASPCLVEAAGIEPASRDISMRASTCVAVSFKLWLGGPQTAGSPTSKPGTFLALPVPGGEGGRFGFGDGLLSLSD